MSNKNKIKEITIRPHTCLMLEYGTTGNKYFKCNICGKTQYTKNNKNVFI